MVISTNTLQTIYDTTISRFISDYTKQKHLTPNYYKTLSYFGGTTKTEFNDVTIRHSDFDSKSLRSQLDSERSVIRELYMEIDAGDVFFDVGA